MLSSDRESYSQLVDTVVVGPVNLSSTEVNMVLGVNQELFNKSKKKRTDMIESGNKPTWLEKDKQESSKKMERVQSLPPLPLFGKRKHSNGTNSLGSSSNSSNNSMLRSALEKQFNLFSRFGGSETQGSRITLTQSDKWLRQAGVIDSWTITTIDTALAFR